MKLHYTGGGNLLECGDYEEQDTVYISWYDIEAGNADKLAFVWDFENDTYDWLLFDYKGEYIEFKENEHRYDIFFDDMHHRYYGPTFGLKRFDEYIEFAAFLAGDTPENIRKDIEYWIDMEYRGGNTMNNITIATPKTQKLMEYLKRYEIPFKQEQHYIEFTTDIITAQLITHKFNLHK